MYTLHILSHFVAIFPVPISRVRTWFEYKRVNGRNGTCLCKLLIAAQDDGNYKGMNYGRKTELVCNEIIYS